MSTLITLFILIEVPRITVECIRWRELGPEPLTSSATTLRAANASTRASPGTGPSSRGTGWLNPGTERAPWRPTARPWSGRG
jgi:hypothetical protein